MYYKSPLSTCISSPAGKCEPSLEQCESARGSCINYCSQTPCKTLPTRLKSYINYLDAKRVKDFRIIFIFSDRETRFLQDCFHFILQLSRFTSTKFSFNFQDRVSRLLNIASTITLYQGCRHTAFVSKRRNNKRD